MIWDALDILAEYSYGVPYGPPYVVVNHATH